MSLKITLKNTLKIFFCVLLTLSALRFILFMTHSEDFDALSLFDIVISCLIGLKIDFIVSCWFFALPVTLSFLPLRCINTAWAQIAIKLLYFLGINALILINIGDFLYFSHVHRHLANELALLGNDWNFLLETALSHWPWIFGVVIFEALLLAFFTFAIEQGKSAPSLNGKNTLIFILIVIALVFGCRGKLSGKPFGLSDAFSTDQSASGQLALNGVFSLFKSRKAPHITFDHTNDQAFALVQKQLLSPQFQFANPDYPLLRQNHQTQNRLPGQPNVVIVLLESWSAQYIDSFSNNHLGLTPNFDELARHGIRFTQFFANGQRSIEGITSLLTGIPLLPYQPSLGHGMELSRHSYLGSIAKANGYSTLAMQSSERNSFRVDSIMTLAGFSNYYGAEDIPNLGLETSGKNPAFGTWDNNMLQFYVRKISELKPPFLAFTFTASTHSDFISPGQAWEVYPHDEHSLLGYFNTLRYVDEAIGRFMQAAATQPWFEDTIFIFMADHTLGLRDTDTLEKAGVHLTQERELENMRIPLLIYAPKYFSGHTSSRLGSQADILPTLVQLLGWETPFSSLSQSLFAEVNQPFVVFANGTVLGYITPNGYLKHNFEKTLDNTLTTNDEDAALAFYQSIVELEKTNRLVPIK